MINTKHVMNEIIDKVNEILVEEFEVDMDVILPTKNLKETLNLDSLDYVDLVVIIESNFGVKLVEADFAHLSTFEDFYTIIEQKMKDKTS